MDMSLRQKKQSGHYFCQLPHTVFQMGLTRGLPLLGLFFGLFLPSTTAGKFHFFSFFLRLHARKKKAK